MADEPVTIEVSKVIAGAVHDIKNSLGALASHLYWLSQELKQLQNESLTKRVYDLEYESRRINNDLVRLLTLYRLSDHAYSVDPRLQYLPEFLEELGLEHQRLLAARGIAIETDCPDGLSWYFDRHLVSVALANAINNAYRYARARVRVSAAEEEGILALRVEDDGPGFPASSLEALREIAEHHYSEAHSSTRFGLYFAQTVAALHRADGRGGYIAIGNGGAFGGGVLTIYLP